MAARPLKTGDSGADAKALQQVSQAGLDGDRTWWFPLSMVQRRSFSGPAHRDAKTRKVDLA
jgi:hypothetical protein